jgi:hypothetical protein
VDCTPPARYFTSSIYAPARQQTAASAFPEHIKANLTIRFRGALFELFSFFDFRFSIAVFTTIARALALRSGCLLQAGDGDVLRRGRWTLENTAARKQNVAATRLIRTRHG